MKKLQFICILLMFLIIFSGCKTDKQPEPDTTEEISSTAIPILMYHHFTEDSSTELYTVVTKNRFSEQITALKKAGFNTVTTADIINYAEGKGNLPENPILITMDDGYKSNVTIAAPILKEHGMCATVFVIGITAGQEYYAHSGAPLSPARFGGKDAEAFIQDGIINIQSHTFDMHQLVSYGYSLRDGVRIKDGETEEEYRAALAEDINRSIAEIKADFGCDVSALAYPFGYFSDIADEVFMEAGIKLTVTTNEDCSVIEKGNPESLWRLSRINVTDAYSGEALIARIEELLK